MHQVCACVFSAGDGLVFIRRYIRIVGTHNTMNKSFHLVSLICMYTMKIPKINKNGIISALYVCV